MKLPYHTGVSLAIGGLLYLSFKSFGIAAGSVLAGIFIDLDHFYDYFREHGFSMNIREFFHFNNHCQYDRIILFFHGWEWMFTGLACAWLSGWNPWITGISIGIGHHLLLDTLGNSKSLISYSLLWRRHHNFVFDRVFCNLKGKKNKYRKSFSNKKPPV